MNRETVLVVDAGSSSIKAGYSGEDVPSYVFPSTVAKVGGGNTQVCVLVNINVGCFLLSQS